MPYRGKCKGVPMFFGSSHSVYRRCIHVGGTEYDSAWGELESLNCLVQNLMTLRYPKPTVANFPFFARRFPYVLLYSASPSKQTGRLFIPFFYGGRE